MVTQGAGRHPTKGGGWRAPPSAPLNEVVLTMIICDFYGRAIRLFQTSVKRLHVHWCTGKPSKYEGEVVCLTSCY